MNTPKAENVFNRSGLAALSDFKSPGYQSIFSQLVWEYPYVYYHLRKKSVLASPASSPKVVDLGSGVTFFPFAAANLGYEVICLDIDVVCGPDIERASSVVPQQHGKVFFRLIADDKLPVKSGEVDVVYCVSVLEHIPNFENTIEEVFRILKVGGLFILTIDLDSCGYLDIGVKRYYDLRKCLSKRFDLNEPEITVHPMDVLQSQNGPYMMYSTWQKWKFHLKQRMKPLFRKQPFIVLPNLAVWGGVMTKKA